MRTSILFVAGLSVTLFATGVSAQDATQSVSVEVQAINEISVAGSPSLVINAATAGSAPDVATAAGTWAITTNEANKKITAAIDLALPAGIALTANLDAPTGGSSSGAVTLGTVAADVVTAISTLNESGLAISYELSATSAAGTMISASRTVTYTIATGA